MQSTRVNAIEVAHLRRTFISHIGVIKPTAREVIAVDDVSFDIQEGELFGLLGPNGAGKTTTTQMLTTLLIPTSGNASVKGFDGINQADQVRRRIGFIFGGERGLYWAFLELIIFVISGVFIIWTLITPKSESIICWKWLACRDAATKKCKAIHAA